ncbi:MAG: hypothetical protein ACXW03_09005 [Methylobacter sp.]
MAIYDGDRKFAVNPVADSAFSGDSLTVKMMETSMKNRENRL